jgi:hypothetical protein
MIERPFILLLGAETGISEEMKFYVDSIDVIVSRGEQGCTLFTRGGNKFLVKENALNVDRRIAVALKAHWEAVRLNTSFMVGRQDDCS